MSTIDIDKICVCDSCDKTKLASSKKNDIIKIELRRTKKTIYLCEKCTKELIEGLRKELEVQ